MATKKITKAIWLVFKTTAIMPQNCWSLLSASGIV